jgi:hypothetical protein
MDVGAGANTLSVETEGDPSAVWNIDGALLPGDIEVFGGAPYVVLQPGLAGADTTIDTVDPTYVSLSDDALFDIGQAIASGVGSRLSGAVLFGGRAEPSGEPLAYASTAPSAAETYAAFPGVDPTGEAGERRAAWITPFAGAREFDGDAPTLDASHRFAGATGGVDGLVNDALRVGIFAGGAFGRLEVDQSSQTVETGTGTIGGYALWKGGSRFVAGTLSAGAASNDSKRRVLNNLAPNGVETASAEFGSVYVSPEVQVGVRRSLGEHLQVVPNRPPEPHWRMVRGLRGDRVVGQPAGRRPRRARRRGRADAPFRLHRP